jgi:hypothetical protein
MIPNSYTSALIEGLRDNLESAFSVVGIEMSWSDYGIINPLVNNLMGRIFVNTTPRDTINLSTLYFKESFEITLEVIAAHQNSGELYLLAQDLMEFLIKHIMLSVRVSGITGTFRGVQLSNALLGLEIKKAPQIGYEKPQGGLELIQVRFPFIWTKEV